MTISFSGHRTERINQYKTWNEDTEQVKRVQNQLFDMIRLFVSYGETEFICGGALGVDMWAAEAVIQSDLDLMLFLPYKQGYGRNWKNQDDRLRLQELRRKAVLTHCISHGGYAKHLLFKRNEWMVDMSIATVFVYDGQPTGGTYHCLKYARRLKQPYVLISPSNTDLPQYFIKNKRVNEKQFTLYLFGPKVEQMTLLDLVEES